MQLYVTDGPGNWIEDVLAAIPPDPGQTRTLALSLGWVLVPRASWTSLATNSALLLEGVDDTLSTFWLNGPQNLGRLQFDETGGAEVVDLASPAVAIPPELMRLDAEVGSVAIPCTNLADFQPGSNVSLHCTRHPEVRLTHRGKTLALGQLIQFDDGWAVRLSAVAMPRRKSA